MGRDRAELDAARHDDLYHLDHGSAEDTVGPCQSEAPVVVPRRPKNAPNAKEFTPRIFVVDVIYSTDLEMPFDPYSFTRN